MKQARTYETKIRKLLKGMPKTAAESLHRDDPVSALVEGILSANTTAARAAQALSMLEKEYVDFNELRVSPAKDIVEAVGSDLPNAWDKAAQIQTVLGGLFAASCEVSLRHLEGKAKRELRRALDELGLDAYTAAYAMLFIFDMNAVPVDEDLADILELEGLVHPGSTAEEIQTVLERVVGKTMGAAAHAFFRSYVQKKSKVLEKKRKADQKVREEAEALAEAERVATEEAAAAKAALKAKKAEQAAQKKADKAAADKAAAKKTAKKAVKKTTKKAVTKTVKKTAKKAVEKTVKKAVKKVAKKAVKKTTKKAAKKTALRKKAGKK